MSARIAVFNAGAVVLACRKNLLLASALARARGREDALPVMPEVFASGDSGQRVKYITIREHTT